MTDLIELRLSVNNELGDQIVVAWVKQHFEWAQDAYENAAFEEDKSDAAADILAFERVYYYVTGKRILEQDEEPLVEKLKRENAYLREAIQEARAALAGDSHD